MAKRTRIISLCGFIIWSFFMFYLIIYHITVKDAVSRERLQIVKDLKNFSYPKREALPSAKLADFTLETGGIPMRSVIVSSWASGTNYVGDLINSMPGNYYHFTPLVNWDHKIIRDPEESDVALRNLQNLLNCNYSDAQGFIRVGQHNFDFYHRYGRLRSTCMKYPHYCWSTEFLTSMCKLFPFQSMMVVNGRLASVGKLLNDTSLNVRIILLVRDPRGTMQSRKHRDWCPGNPDCDNPEILCNDLVSDYYVAEDLQKKYPSRFRTLRYEDLSISPYEMTQEILQFFGLPFDPMVEQFLDTHTKVNIGGVSSTYRDSKSAPFHWKQDLMIDEIQSIQNKCTKAMDLWGYRKLEDFNDYQPFDPLILPPPFA